MEIKTLSRPWSKIPFGGISANTLRLLAMVGMLLDHLWGTIVSGNLWMTCLGRLVFPIYAFQITEGFFHTSDRKKYIRRLVFFALLAEIPFNYMTMSSLINPFQQNTIWTLLLGLWFISVMDKHRQGGQKGWKTTLKLAGIFLLSVVGFVDYGWKGMLTVVVFYVFRGHKFAWVGQLVCMVVLHGVLAGGQVLPELGNMHLQSLAILGLIPIWLYNGEKGRGGKVFQMVAYWYYPAHLAVLSLLMWLM